MEIPALAIHVDPDRHAQFRGAGDININLFVSPTRNMHLMHNMISNELQFHEAHARTTTV